ncbi:MAG: hypothetical protein ABR954_01010 [Dehalococcoidales bacterium]
MTLVYIIIGGVVGGGLGWLFDRVTRREQPEAAAIDSQPRT